MAFLAGVQTPAGLTRKTGQLLATQGGSAALLACAWVLVAGLTWRRSANVDLLVLRAVRTGAPWGLLDS